MKKLAVIIFTLALLVSGCATTSYDETVSRWTSYKDVSNWMGTHFNYSLTKWYIVAGKCLNGADEKKCLLVQSPEQTFRWSSGVCYDAAVFDRDTLNRINSNYEARLVRLLRLDMGGHYVCGFKIEGKLYIMDYGEVTGPFESLAEYKEKNNQIIKVYFYDKF